MQKIEEFINCLTLNCDTKYKMIFNQFWHEKEQTRVQKLIKYYQKIISKKNKQLKIKNQYYKILIEEEKCLINLLKDCKEEDYEGIKKRREKYSYRIFDLISEINRLNFNVYKFNSLIAKAQNNYENVTNSESDIATRSKIECTKFLTEFKLILSSIDDNKIDELVDFITNNLLLGLRLVHAIYEIQNNLIKLDDCSEEIKKLIEKYCIENRFSTLNNIYNVLVYSK